MAAITTTAAASLDQAILNVAAQIQSVTANPKPNYSVDGQSVSWESYLQALLNQQDNLYKARQMADGPFEVRSRAC